MNLTNEEEAACRLGLAIAVATPTLLSLGGTFIFSYFDAQRGRSADSGGCEMGLASNTITGAVRGMAADAIVGLASNFFRRTPEFGRSFLDEAIQALPRRPSLHIFPPASPGRSRAPDL